MLLVVGVVVEERLVALEGSDDVELDTGSEDTGSEGPGAAKQVI